MENEKEILVKLEAEVVGELAFVPKVQYSVVQHPYTSNYQAELDVKIGIGVKRITLSLESEYVSSTGEGESYVSSHYIYKPDIRRDSANMVEELRRTGVEIDFTKVFTHYEKAVKEAKAHEEILKQEAELKRQESRRILYRTDWMNGFANIIAADKNKKIKAADFVISRGDTEEKFALGSYAGCVKVSYKGYTGTIGKHSDGNYVFNHWFTENELGNRISTSAAKDRKAKNAGTILLKFIEDIDEQLAIIKSRLERNNTEETKRAEFIAKLKENIGYPMASTNERQYHRDHRNRIYGEGYIEYKYFVKLNNKNIRIEMFETEGKLEFRIGGSIGQLNKEQCNAILNIISDTKSDV